MNLFLKILTTVLITSQLTSQFALGSEKSEFYPYAKNKQVMINSSVLAKCMAGLVRAGSVNSLGPAKTYSNNFSDRTYPFTSTCKFSNESFFEYLIVSPKRQCDYETGKEQQLRSWIMKQPDNTIDLLNIFKISLELNGGRAYDAILTIHQLLRNEARFNSKEYYKYESSSELANVFWAKFVDIRGDLAEADKENEGDHRGSWYRIWGIMLYRLNLTEVDRFKNIDGDCIKTEISLPDKLIADFKSSAVAISAELYKYLLDATGAHYKAGADRPGKSRINSAGSQIANGLISSIDNGDYLNPDSSQCSQDKILLNAI